jgi:Tol biopolymer transport system component
MPIMSLQRYSLFSLLALLLFSFPSTLMAQKPVLVSVRASDVSSGGVESTDPVVSANGRFVAFPSSAFNLVPNDNNGRKDVFVRDLQTATTSLVSINLTGTGSGNGDSGRPTISADGRYVVFESGASNLVANDVNNAADVFLRDLQTGTTTLLSTNSTGPAGGNQSSLSPIISANGQVVVFTSFASNLVTNDNNNAIDVFARDLQSGVTRLLSCNATCTAAGNDASVTANVPKDKAPRALISSDGRFVVFESNATDL